MSEHWEKKINSAVAISTVATLTTNEGYDKQATLRLISLSRCNNNNSNINNNTPCVNKLLDLKYAIGGNLNSGQINFVS